ncbi:endonuclease/exonuclease/phosphatase family protein [Isosphaeraceae bacterium EP7]
MRLLSYNIHKGVGGRDRRYRLERILKVIEHEEPDIACLQEVDLNVRRSRHDDQPRLIAETLKNSTLLYQLNVPKLEGGYGNLIVTRWPVLTSHQVSLKLGRRKPRGAQLVVIDTPQGNFHLVHWHLGLAEKERHWQAAHLLNHPLFLESAHLPTLIIGDFNDWRNTLTRGPFAHQGFSQVTAPPSRFRSFPAWMAMGSLDKAFTRGAINVDHAQIVKTHGSRRASDHLPLRIDFSLVPG